MKIILASILTITIIFHAKSQTIINMKKKDGVFYMPCKVNNLPLEFIFDTGASDVVISSAEAIVLLKQNLLLPSDFIGVESYQVASGEINEGTVIIIRKIEIGDLILTNTKATIVHNINAPLLMGQSALSKLGKIEINYSTNTLTINNNSNQKTQSDNLSSNTTAEYYNTIKTSKYYNEKLFRYDEPVFTERKSTEYNGEYLFETTIKTNYSVSLRENGNINSMCLYKCPINSKIYVIGQENDIYMKAYVDGYVGYISKVFLRQKSK